MSRMQEPKAESEIAKYRAGTSTLSLFSEEKEHEYSLSGFLHTWSAVVFQIMLMLAALSVYTFTPLLINHSVAIRTPSDFSNTVVTLPPIGSSKRPTFWLGVDLAHRNGELFVESQTVDGLASMAGVLEGDVVTQVWQGPVVIYDRDAHDRTVTEGESFSCGHNLLSLQNFLQNGTTSSNLHVDPSLDVQVRFAFYRVEVNKAPAYLEVSVILVYKVLGALMCMILAFLRDPRQLRELRFIMKVSIWKEMAPACLANCIADACEVYAAGRIPAALYSVLLRLNLLGVAIVSYFVLGTRQSPLQVSILLGLTCLVFCYAQVPDIVPEHRVWDGFGEPKDPSSAVVADSLSMFGLACVFGKIGGAIGNSVLGEKVMKGPALGSEPLVVIQGINFVVCSLIFTPFAMFMAYGTEWHYGLFGGGDVSFRHCSADWTKEACAGTVAWTLPQGWDIRTLAVVGLYISREFVLNKLLREFSSIVRHLRQPAPWRLRMRFPYVFLGRTSTRQSAVSSLPSCSTSRSTQWRRNLRLNNRRSLLLHKPRSYLSFAKLTQLSLEAPAAVEANRETFGERV
eukprot:TRINITY_DN9622_c0_g1_i2.p1 TRINITY_DN9622_c0_g1~~TRINITY_DN9622_c0_g1_i2.p1  ORF type:complete len:587 (-),score=50.94 TRINITY_DN9622_c0_g1_i2:484-2190(-)